MGAPRHKNPSESFECTPAASTVTSFPSVSRVYKAPEWHDFGALRGYRVGFSTYDALWSAFSVHQDTLNIWVHAMGFIYFLLAIPHTVTALGQAGAPSRDYIFFGIFLMCALFQMLTSVLYHLFRCVSKSTNEFFLSLDMLGILVMIGGSWVVGMTQGFYCRPLMAVGYLASELSLLAISLRLIFLALRGKLSWLPVYLCIAFAVAFGLLPCVQMYWECSLERCPETIQRGFLGMFGNYFIGSSPPSPTPPTVMFAHSSPQSLHPLLLL